MRDRAASIRSRMRARGVDQDVQRRNSRRRERIPDGAVRICREGHEHKGRRCPTCDRSSRAQRWARGAAARAVARARRARAAAFDAAVARMTPQAIAWALGGAGRLGASRL